MSEHEGVFTLQFTLLPAAQANYRFDNNITCAAFKSWNKAVNNSLVYEKPTFGIATNSEPQNTYHQQAEDLLIELAGLRCQ